MATTVTPTAIDKGSNINIEVVGGKDSQVPSAFGKWNVYTEATVYSLVISG